MSGLVTAFLERCFAHPGLLSLLVVIPLASVVHVWAQYRRRRHLRRWGAALRDPGTGLNCQTLALAAAFTLLLIAVAGPRWGRDPEPQTRGGRDIVAVLDMSRSMAAQDVLGESSPDRFGRAKDALLDLARAVQEDGGHRLALIAFAARPTVACPLTPDSSHFSAIVANLEMDFPPEGIGPELTGPSSGTRIGAALIQAVVAHDTRFSGAQDIILLSDGDDPANDREWEGGAAAASAKGIRVHAVGIGDPMRDSPILLAHGEPLRFAGQVVQTHLHEAPLETIARLTGGVYVPARRRPVSLATLFRERIEPLATRQRGDDVPAQAKPRYEWFMAAALGLFTLVSVRGNRAGAAGARP